MSNFVISRRALQRSVDRLAVTLRRSDLANLVARLNRTGDDRLRAMWEAVLLDLLAQEGDLQHEIPLPDGRKPDFALTIPSDSTGPLKIIGDITSVSDHGLDAQNPVDSLRAEIRRLAEKHGLSSNHFSVDIGGGRRGPLGKQRVKLDLPSWPALLNIVRSDVDPWLRKLAKATPTVDKLIVTKSGAAFSVSYNQRQRAESGVHVSYDVTVSLTENSLFRALGRKADQVQSAPSDCIRLAIACDGGCYLLANDRTFRTPGTYTSLQVARDFLRQRQSIDFVLLISVLEKRSMLSPMDVKRTMRIELVTAPKGSRSNRVTEATVAAVEVLVARLRTGFPAPQRTPLNAAVLCQDRGPGADRIGAFTMSGDRVKISARAVHRLLAGDISDAEFHEAHGWEGVGTNPFKRMLAAGRTLRLVTVEDGGDRDDDWLEFEFGPPDPAVGPIIAPD